MAYCKARGGMTKTALLVLFLLRVVSLCVSVYFSTYMYPVQDLQVYGQHEAPSGDQR